MEHSAKTLVKRFNEYLRRLDLGFLATAMSPRWYFMDFYVYPPLIMLCLATAFDGGPWQIALSFVLVPTGVLVWTLAEYLIHRFAFHHFPGLKPMHMEHHAKPEGLHGSPTLVTVLVFAVLAFLPLWYLTNLAMAAALTAGLMAGYVAYVAVHYALHHVTSLGPRWMSPDMRLRLRNLVKAHAVHHHQLSYNFGVTTTFWDWVFGTLHRR